MTISINGTNTKTNIMQVGNRLFTDAIPPKQKIILGSKSI